MRAASSLTWRWLGIISCACWFAVQKPDTRRPHCDGLRRKPIWHSGAEDHLVGKLPSPRRRQRDEYGLPAVRAHGADSWPVLAFRGECRGEGFSPCTLTTCATRSSTPW